MEIASSGKDVLPYRTASPESPPPEISVIICVHNHIRFLEKTLAGVYNQSLQNFEIIIVDDASPKRVQRWFARRKFDRLRYLRSPRNIGLAMARNHGFNVSRGRLIALLDSDDVWYSDYLEKMRSCFQDSRIMVAASNFNLINAHDDVLRKNCLHRRKWRGWERSSVFQREYHSATGFRTPIFPSFAVIRRPAYKAVNGFDERFKRILDDWDFFYRIGLRHGSEAFHCLDKSLGARRYHKKQSTFFIPKMTASMPRLTNPRRIALCDAAAWMHKYRHLLRPRRG